ncbi:glycosyltransferase family 2 protein [Candidatus Bathyarchaeota archaeon]|nr:glycosyltransferase family 2 protein [Candidatus Bathyarchaeota archaeon]
MSREVLELQEADVGGKAFVAVVCIPAYNVEKTIGRTVLQAKKHVDRVIVCNDGSEDMTGEIAEGLGAIVLTHPKNMGYGAALATLFSASARMGADAMVTIDGDGQHDASQIPRLLEPLRNGDVDLVIGSRFQRAEDSEEVPGYRRMGLGVINGLAKKLSFDELTDSQSGFRAYNHEAIKLLRPSEEGMGASTEILLKAFKAGLALKEVPAKITYGDGSSNHNPLAHGLEVVLTTMKQLSMRRPLLFYGVPGALSLLVGLVFLVWTFQIYTIQRVVETNVALVGFGASMVGLVLMTTSVILWVVLSAVRERNREY